jgi:hypothetical protein
MRLDTTATISSAPSSMRTFSLRPRSRAVSRCSFGRRDFVAHAASISGSRAAAVTVGGTPRAARTSPLPSWVRRWRQTLARWEAILVEHPRDLVASRRNTGTLWWGRRRGTADSVGAGDACLGRPRAGLWLCSAPIRSASKIRLRRRGARAPRRRKPTADVWAALSLSCHRDAGSPARVSWIDGLDANGMTCTAPSSIRWHRCLYHLDSGIATGCCALYAVTFAPDRPGASASLTPWRCSGGSRQCRCRRARRTARRALRAAVTVLIRADLRMCALAQGAGAPVVEHWAIRPAHAEGGGETQSTMADPGLAFAAASLPIRRRVTGAASSTCCCKAATIRRISGGAAARSGSRC